MEIGPSTLKTCPRKAQTDSLRNTTNYNIKQQIISKLPLPKFPNSYQDQTK